jgi:hypothetical protein
VVTRYETEKLTTMEFDLEGYSSQIDKWASLILRYYYKKIESLGTSSFNVKFTSTKCIIYGYVDHVKMFHHEISKLNLAGLMVYDQIILEKESHLKEYSVLSCFNCK